MNYTRTPIRRPKSLREVAAEARFYREFGRHLKDFLHEFAWAKGKGRSLEPMLTEEPPRMEGRFPEGKICDAYLAATADYLSRKNGFASPAWSLADDRILEEPWFAEELPSIRQYLLRDTPSAFKDKNIFTLESALSVG
jgi:hypothetical protein